MSSAAEQAQMLANRVRKNMRRLRPWLRREQVSCYRLYDRDIPEIPVVIDRYGDRLHAAEYRRFVDPLRSGGAWMAELLGAVADELGISSDEIYIKERDRQRGAGQYHAAGAAEHRVEVAESGLRFWVNLRDYVDTGLFLDHRPLRGRVRTEAGGLRFLNLFCYTGSFTVYAAAGGAARTVSVDLSSTYLQWTAANLKLNDLPLAPHELRRGDALAVVAELATAGERFDLAVVDPPTFSNSKRTDNVWEVQRDHSALLSSVMAMMRPGGVVYFSTNARRFELDAAAIPAADCRDITAKTLPPDFRDRRAHRCFRLVRG